MLLDKLPKLSRMEQIEQNTPKNYTKIDQNRDIFVKIVTRKSLHCIAYYK